MYQLIEQMLELGVCQYSLWKYDKSHETVVLRAVSLSLPKKEVFLHFVEVVYIQMPTHWIGALELGSDEEFSALFKYTSINGDIEFHKKVYSLFQAVLKNGTAYLIGKIILIESND